jgi:ribosomal protein S18 acetylase RimI-like enzyme
MREAVIRRAVEEDVSVIVEFNYALFQEDARQRDPFMNLNWPREEGHEYFSKLLKSEKSLGLLAEVDGQVVGYLIGYMMRSSTLRPVRLAELESMYVREEYRSRGIGQQLVERFLEWARGQGGERVSVTAYAANERAIAFYRKLGFAPKSLTLELGL